MNNKFKIKETHNVSEASSFEDRKIKSGLNTSPLRNNKTMKNNYKSKRHITCQKPLRLKIEKLNPV